tara:strand:- start:4868 stop:6508 length:1641 start_codon:yes stop_codon:yes gene_type:complete
MSEQANGTPVATPDVLMNQPLARQMDVDIESTILEPVSHNYNTTNGGTTTFILPQKGVLRARDALIRFQLTSQEGNNLVGYNFAVGGAGCINTITARCGGTIISQNTRAGHYLNIKQNFMEHEKRVGIIDARHCSSHDVELNVAQATIATGSADLAFQQLYNPDCDQVNGLGNCYNGGVAINGHQLQISKCLSGTVLQSPEIIVRLGDLFEIFDENDLPTMGMAQIEITIEWNPCGDPLAQVGAAARLDNVVIDAAIPGVAADAINAAPTVAQLGTVTMDTPTMLLDYIHYPQEEQQKIVDSINSPGGLRINFSEVLYTRGINPEAAATGQVSSNHILGMAMKEVKKIYVAKNYDPFTTQGIAELNADFNGVKTHRNILTNQFRSQQIPGESYNFFINNNRVYDTDVSNPAVAHDYLSQCRTNFRVPGIYYDTTNYNANKTRILLDTQYADGAQGAFSRNAGRSKMYLAGSCNYIGLNLDKYNSLGSTIGNGTRIGSSPIEFNYNRLAIAADGFNGGHRAQVDLDFYIVYRRSLVIRALGIDTSDA